MPAPLHDFDIDIGLWRISSGVPEFENYTRVGLSVSKNDAALFVLGPWPDHDAMQFVDARRFDHDATKFSFLNFHHQSWASVAQIFEQSSLQMHATTDKVTLGT